MLTIYIIRRLIILIERVITTRTSYFFLFLWHDCYNIYHKYVRAPYRAQCRARGNPSPKLQALWWRFSPPLQCQTLHTEISQHFYMKAYRFRLLKNGDFFYKIRLKLDIIIKPLLIKSPKLTKTLINYYLIRRAYRAYKFDLISYNQRKSFENTNAPL